MPYGGRGERKPLTADNFTPEQVEKMPWLLTTLYRFFNEDGDLLYVGITETGMHRMKAHQREKHWWEEVASATMVAFPVPH